MPGRSHNGGNSRGEAGNGPCPRTSALLGLRPTMTGLAFMAIEVLILAAAMSSEANLLFLVFCLSIGMLVLSVATPVLMVRRVDVDRVVPPAAVAGRPFTMVYLVRCRRRWGACWGLTIREAPSSPRIADLPQAFIERVGRDGEERVELLACCPFRGRLRSNAIRVTSRFPVGLFTCSVELRRPLELVVYPQVGRLRTDLLRSVGDSDSRAEKHGRERRAEDEFAGVREFREGDNYRWIHWRRSAHAGELVVREYLPRQASQLIVLLDPWPGSDGVAQPRAWGPLGLGSREAAIEPHVERVIGAAATAACDALERGHRVGLVCRGSIPVVLSPAGGRPHRQRLLHEMALLAPGAPDSLADLVARIRWAGGWHARCLLCVPRMAQEHQRVLRFLGRRAESVMVAIPGTDWFESVFSSTADRAAERRAR